MRRPLVSILLPVHNSEKNLKECIKSIRRQSYRNTEIIAIDDRSYDSSYKLLKSFKKNHPKKLRIYRNTKRYGIVMTLNRLLRKAKGDFIGFIDTNDILNRDRIKKQVLYLLENPDVVALGTQCIFINKKNRKIGKSNFPLQNRDIYSASPLHGFSMQLETVLINKSLLPKDLLRFESHSTPFVYSDFLIKLLPYGKFENLGAFLHRHRKNPNDYIIDLGKNVFSLLKLWLKSTVFYDYSPSIRLFLTSLFRTTLRASLDRQIASSA